MKKLFKLVSDNNFVLEENQAQSSTSNATPVPNKELEIANEVIKKLVPNAKYVGTKNTDDGRVWIEYERPGLEIHFFFSLKEPGYFKLAFD
jgi:hypothetical protein